MKRFWAVSFFGFAVVFDSLSAPTSQPPVSAEQLRSRLGLVQKSVRKGREQVFDVSYETVTNKLSALKPNPAAGGCSIPGAEITPGEYYLCVPEEPLGDVSGKDTSILVTRIDSTRTRVQMKTVKLGLFFNGRDRKVEEQRLKELARLLSNND